jgi:hypothetical protein
MSGAVSTLHCAGLGRGARGDCNRATSRRSDVCLDGVKNRVVVNVSESMRPINVNRAVAGVIDIFTLSREWSREPVAQLINETRAARQRYQEHDAQRQSGFIRSMEKFCSVHGIKILRNRASAIRCFTHAEAASPAPATMAIFTAQPASADQPGRRGVQKLTRTPQ